MQDLMTDNFFVEISEGVCIPKNDIKLITQRKTASLSFKALVEEKKASNKYLKLANPKKIDNVYVLTDDKLYLISYTYEEIINKCLASGIKLIKVSSDAYVCLSYIKAIYDLKNDKLEYYLKNNTLPKAILQFVSQREERKTALVLRNDEIIYLSKSSKEILENA